MAVVNIKTKKLCLLTQFSGRFWSWSAQWNEWGGQVLVKYSRLPRPQLTRLRQPSSRFCCYKQSGRKKRPGKKLLSSVDPTGYESARGCAVFWISVCFFMIFFSIFKLKFMFSKKATKNDKIFTVDLTLCSKRQIDGEDFVNFRGLLRKCEL